MRQVSVHAKQIERIRVLQSGFSPERFRSDTDVHLLHTQVPCGRGLTRAAGNRRDRQAAKEEVHGGQEGLQETDGAESRASVGGEVDFIGVRAGWLQESLILTDRTEGKERVQIRIPDHEGKQEPQFSWSFIP